AVFGEAALGVRLSHSWPATHTFAQHESAVADSWIFPLTREPAASYLPVFTSPAYPMDAAPDFAAVDDRALDAALAIALFGAAEIVYHPCWYDGECGDLHAEGDHAHPFFEGLLRGREDAELHPCTVRYAEIGRAHV